MISALSNTAAAYSLTAPPFINSLSQMAEAIGKLALAALFKFAHLISLNNWKNGADLSDRLCKEAWSILEPLNGERRENRVQVGAELIQRKLGRELNFAKIQMQNERDNPHFKFGLHQVDKPLSEEELFVLNSQVGVVDTIGRRSTMEDRHIAISFDLEIRGEIFPVKLFGVFDGHAGDEAAHFLKENLQNKLTKKLQEFNREGLTQEGIWNALKLSFVELNRQFEGYAGSTATVAMILDNQLWTANVGDARTILQNGENVTQLTEDAKPYDPRYLRGIRNRGGEVYEMRVDGILAVARAVGDHAVRGVNARPKITRIPLTGMEPNSHLVLACDGIWDVATTRQIGQAIAQNRTDSALTLAQKIVSSSYQAGSGDNLSAMVVKLSN